MENNMTIKRKRNMVSPIPQASSTVRKQSSSTHHQCYP
uniref:Uncharacterized protein n=1 Tax=Arundo donax TaxID=35708 RepID=A0A0A9A285_ARUDO